MSEFEPFGCSNFLIRRDFSSNPARLRKRLMAVGLCMLMLSPFLIIFMLMYFFLRNAEQFYHQPSAAGSRRWSNLSKWTFREFNEVYTLSCSRGFVTCVALFRHFPTTQVMCCVHNHPLYLRNSVPSDENEGREGERC